MRARVLCLLLLSACTDPNAGYDVALTWVCRSPEGCERAEAVALLDRIDIAGDTFWFLSTRNEAFGEPAQRLASDSLPAGCAWLYGFSLFGYELEPSKLCDTADGFELELAIPNVLDPATQSQWLVIAREL